MKKATERISVKGADELADVDALFEKLNKDKGLPSFGEHFMSCLIAGTSENVNLKAMYPKTHSYLSTWLEIHREKSKQA